MARYPSDLTDTEWEIVKVILEQDAPYTRGRPAKVDYREVLNAIFYITTTGCQWRYLPKDFPSYTLVSYYYHKWTRTGLFAKINTALRRRLRKQAGRNEDPSAGIIDSQSVKSTPESYQESGFDGGKRVKGRKRHIITDTMGYLLVVVVHAANIYDARGARKVFNKLFEWLDTLKLIWADGAYTGDLINWVYDTFGCLIKVVNKKRGKGFQVLPRRWVVERTLAWLTRYRRLSKDYERTLISSESMVYVASIRLMLKQLNRSSEQIEVAV